MATRLNPYISFDGNAQAAMEFYREVFGGALNVMTYGQMGDENMPGADKVMHGMLETDTGMTLMGADHPPGEQWTAGNNMSVSLSGDDEAELRGYWDRLADGGTVAVPLERQMWGDVFGMCTDRFGVSWMVNIAQSQG